MNVAVSSARTARFAELSSTNRSAIRFAIRCVDCGVPKDATA